MRFKDSGNIVRIQAIQLPVCKLTLDCFLSLSLLIQFDFQKKNP